MPELSSMHDIMELDTGFLSFWIKSIIGLSIASIILAITVRMRRKNKYIQLLTAEINHLLKHHTEEKIEISLSRLTGVIRAGLMYAYQREIAAGKVGAEYIRLIQDKEMKGYDWSKNLNLITSYPYLPKEIVAEKINFAKISEIANNYKRWLKNVRV